ncbi:HlyC/CorC family transporter [Geovibrio thiophilus]|uniref:HlyC/CorC family transporter n=1 Tax=Geovibrio thiophilus TaxID=139438 RepID=A0A3R5XWY3_9BACT|nr:hemolysin family protein [Geovibrio thiophilus]QAR33228.1 HlyC/CorC family transporter [Geovibrio thiophilus]
METDSILFQSVSIFVCLILSGFFSGSETALTSLSEMKVRHMIEENPKAKILELWIYHPNKVLNTILIGNNIVNILASVIAADMMQKIFGNTQIAAVTGVMTLMILIFGEITPKTFAKHNAKAMAIALMRILKVFYTVFFPATYVMNKLVVAMIKLSGGKLDKKPQITEEELEFIINVGEKEGVLENGQKEMLQNIFELGDMSIKEIMVPRRDIIAVNVNEDFDSIMNKVVENEFSRLPVYEETIDKIIGILNAKDLLVFTREDVSKFNLRGMLRAPYFIPGTKKIDNMLTEFQKTRNHMAIVLDEYGGVAGLLTLENVLEEIVGDIYDEYDQDEVSDTEVEQTDADTYILDAMMDIDDFCEEFGIEKTEEMEKYETLAGLVYDLAGRVPEQGDSYVFGGSTLTVLEIEDRKICRIEMKKIQDTPVADDVEV